MKREKKDVPNNSPTPHLSPCISPCLPIAASRARLRALLCYVMFLKNVPRVRNALHRFTRSLHDMALRVPPPNPADPARGWHNGSGAAVDPPPSPALTLAVGMGLMLSVPLLLALTVASCWRRCQKQLAARRWSRKDLCHRPAARWSECREDPSDDDDDEPVTPRRLLRRDREDLASSDVEEVTPRRQLASRPGRMSRRGAGERCASTEQELTKVFFRSSDWSSRGCQPRMTELSLQGVTSVQELCARLKDALGGASGSAPHGVQVEGLALCIEYQNGMGEMVQLTRGAEMDVLDGVRSLYVTTNRAKSLLPDSTSNATPMSRCSSSQPLVAADDDDGAMLLDTCLSGCCGVKSTCGGIEVASSAVARKQSRSERHKSRLIKLKHYVTL